MYMCVIHNRPQEAFFQALWSMAVDGDTDGVVRLLSESTEGINYATPGFGCTPLIKAAEKGHESTVRTLAELKADLNQARNGGCTPLFMAAQKGHEATVRMLAELKADFNQAMNNGATPLFAGAQMGRCLLYTSPSPRD